MKTTSIFIQIAAYRDPQLIPTVLDALDKSSGRNRLVFGICHQHATGEETLPFSGSSFRIDAVPFHESRGACWARNRIQQLYDGETYTLHLDSHHRFAPGWDQQLIETHQSLQADKPLLTAYLPAYDVADDTRLDPMACSMAFDRFSDGGAAIFLPKKFAMPPSQPVPARFYSGHFCFGPGSFAQEVQHDPEFYFIGEEISLSVRAYTHGYDLFHPHQAVIWHEYTRAGRPKHWDDHEGENQLVNWLELDALSKGRNRSLLNMDSVQTKSATLGRFGLGKVRSLHDYERFAGIDFSTASVSRHLLENLPPPGPDAELSIQEWQSQLLRQHVIAARLNEQLMDQVRSSDKLNISVLNDDDEIIHTEAFDSAKIGEIALDETLRFEVTCFSQDAPRLLLVEPEHTDGRLDSPFALAIDASKG